MYLLALAVLGGFAFIASHIPLASSWQRTGLVNASLGFMVLAAYACAQIFKIVGLPLISGYIFAGILFGPQALEFVTDSMVHELHLIDELALNFIALSAGGMLHTNFLLQRRKAIFLNVTLQTLAAFAAVFLFVVAAGSVFESMKPLSSLEILALAILLGVSAVARSPSSAIAIISETRAEGTFTETVLGVTVVVDVLIIILFTLAIAIDEMLLLPGQAMMLRAIGGVSLNVLAALVLGAIIGKAIAIYIDRAGYDLPLFLLLFAFSVSKCAFWLNHYAEEYVGVALELEPLLICMSAGFTVQNFSRTGRDFMEGLDRFSLPIYILFFALAGASLDLQALGKTWPLAVGLALIRAGGIFGAAWLAGRLCGDPKKHGRVAGMAYLTQAGVAIGLAQLAQRQFPEIGVYLVTVVLAVITINQIVGPITFKAALELVGETGKRRGSTIREG